MGIGGHISADDERQGSETSAGNNPPVKSAAIETPVTEPMVMRTRLGGMVSLIAPEAESRATSSPGRAPRRFISGNSTGAIAAMSATLVMNGSPGGGSPFRPARPTR